MECSEPGIVRDEELLAYLEGEKVRPVVAQHLARCQHCSAQLAAYQQIERELTRKLYRWDCPASQVLGEYHLGLLSSQQALEVRNHLSMCVLCVGEVAMLTEFLAHDPVLVESSALPSSLNNHHAAHPAKHMWEDVVGQVHTGVRRIVAALIPAQPRLAYQRDAAQQNQQWPRRYSAEDVQISIQLERQPGREGALQLIGFVTRQGAALESLEGIPVLLSARVVYTQKIDDLGNFVFAAVVPATYTLELQFPERTIVIDQLLVIAEQ